ncbi:KTSC domain-containing protein [Ottowia sp. VDI28]|uniref:KTSC domain-containing protein n=1 Tax=Ottowia sp. VDI28 TaxID=3133968 RepID=UPI003C2CA93B
MNKKFPTPQAFSEKPYVAIPMAQVESHQIACIGFCADTNTLAVRFLRGDAEYHYPGVLPETHQAFMDAESKGAFFEQHIRPLGFEKFRPPAPEGDGLQKQEEAA